MDFSFLFDIAAGQIPGTTQQVVASIPRSQQQIQQVAQAVPKLQQQVSKFGSEAERFAHAQLILQGISAAAALTVAIYTITRGR